MQEVHAHVISVPEVAASKADCRFHAAEARHGASHAGVQLVQRALSGTIDV
jgi:hypothetical protein